MINGWLLTSIAFAFAGILLMFQASRVRRAEKIEKRLPRQKSELENQTPVSKVIGNSNEQNFASKRNGTAASDQFLKDIFTGWIPHKRWLNRLPTLLKGGASIVGALTSICVTWMIEPKMDTAIYWLLSGLVGLIAGYLILQIGLKQFQFVRRRKLEQLAPDIVDFLVLAVGAGTSFDRAVMEITPLLAPVNPEMARQLSHLSHDLAVLPMREKAFENLELRTGSVTFGYLKAYLIQSEKYGTPVVQALKQVANDARKLSLSVQQEKARKLPVYISIPLMLMILPPIVVISTGPGFVQLMRTF